MSTAFQEQVLAFVRDELDRFNVAPTVREIAERIDVHDCHVRSSIEALIQQGRLERTGAKTRNLRMAGVPDLSVVGSEVMKAELARRGETLAALAPPRRMHGDRLCAVTQCRQTVRPGMLMCRTHWLRVERSTRELVLATCAARDEKAFQAAVDAAKAEIDAQELAPVRRRA